MSSAAIAIWLSRASAEPTGLVIEGEAGIGKTTAWREAVHEAHAAGFRVLSARASAAEARLTYSVLADLLEGVEESVLQCLPEVQRAALDRVLLSGKEGPATDERVAAAAFRSVVQVLAEESPVLVAIDDLPWLDRASQVVIGYAARRLEGPVGVLATARTADPDCPDTNWLQMSKPGAVERLTQPPMSLGALHRAISIRLGVNLARPLLVRIHEVSAGNPFYALEMARIAESQSGAAEMELPPSLTKLMDARLRPLDQDTHTMLLAVACAADPTAAQLAQVLKVSSPRIIELIEVAENHGIVALDGLHVRFTHPLLARGVYVQASPGKRRAMHRTMATLTDLPELRARHLALAAVSAEESTLLALDTAADAAVARGAPSAAGELTELAISLGGDTALRRLRAAEQHFRAGAFKQADNHLEPVISTQEPGALRAIALMLRGAVYSYGDNVEQAALVLGKAIDEVGDIPALRVRGLLLQALTLGLQGDLTAALDSARRAVADAESVGNPDVRSQALTIWVQLSFVHGLGTDEKALQAALDLEDPDAGTPVAFRASAINAVNCAWTGNLQEARTQLAAILQQCLDRGHDVDVIWAAHFTSLVDVWLGRYEDAARLAHDTVARAEQIGGQLPMMQALYSQAAVAAHLGHEDEARRAASIGGPHDDTRNFMSAARISSLAFLEVSLGDYSAALAVAQPLLDAFDPVHGTEIMVGGFLPDAIETLVTLGHPERAEPLVAALETNGTRLDRAWMLAMGARGRAMLLAVSGELDAAAQVAECAMRHHDRLPMPFERARTQLLVAQLQRRRRQRHAATQTFTEALKTFEALGATLWAARTRSELARSDIAPTDSAALTRAERRVAERAATGLSNRDIAAELFLSAKTVEMNLSRVYRKLGIRSRAALASALSTSPQSERIGNTPTECRRTD